MTSGDAFHSIPFHICILYFSPLHSIPFLCRHSILIAVNSVVKISDFGASREWRHEMSTPMSFCGTPAWLAPELIRNEPCSERVDVWCAASCVVCSQVASVITVLP